MTTTTVKYYYQVLNWTSNEIMILTTTTHRFDLMINDKVNDELIRIN